jgi:chromosome segregation ATPase
MYLILMVVALVLATLQSGLSSMRPRPNSSTSKVGVTWSFPLIKESRTDPHLLINEQCSSSSSQENLTTTEDEEDVENPNDMESLMNELKYLRETLDAHYKEFDDVLRNLHDAQTVIRELEESESRLLEQVNFLKQENLDLANRLNTAKMMIRLLSAENYQLSKRVNT